jgi:hypothetical protein
MNRKYEGLLSALLIAASLCGCGRGEPKETVAGNQGGTPAVKNTPLGTVTEGPGTGGAEPGVRSPAPQAAPMPGVRPGAAPRPSPGSIRRSVSNSGGWTTAPSAPTRPKADQVIDGTSFKTGGVTTEIEGICKISEDSVACWTPTGASHADLQKRVEESLTRERGMGGGGNVRIAYKKKNRVVVVKTTHETSGISRQGASVNLMSVGDSMNGGDYINLYGLGDRSFEPGKPMSSYQARMVAAKPSERSTSAFFGVTEQSPKRTTLDLRKGATCSIEDAELAVVSIKKGSQVPGRENGMYGGFMGREGKAEIWTIEVKSKKATSKYHPSLYSEVFVDEKGNAVSREAYEKVMMNAMSMPRTAPKPGEPYTAPPRPRYTQVMIQPLYGSSGGSWYYIINANPSTVKQVTVMASRTRQVELKGIRLDPR